MSDVFDPFDDDANALRSIKSALIVLGGGRKRRKIEITSKPPRGRFREKFTASTSYVFWCALDEHLHPTGNRFRFNPTLLTVKVEIAQPVLYEKEEQTR